MGPSFFVRERLPEVWHEIQIELSNDITGFSVGIGITVGIEWIKALRENNVESSVALLTQSFPTTENLPPASEISFFSPDNNSSQSLLFLWTCESLPNH